MRNWLNVMLGMLIWLSAAGSAAWAEPQVSAQSTQGDQRVVELCEQLNQQRQRFNQLQDEVVPLFLMEGKPAQMETQVLNSLARLSYGKMLLNSANTAFNFDEEEDLEPGRLEATMREQANTMTVFGCTPAVVYEVVIDELQRQCDDVTEALDQSEDFLQQSREFEDG